MLRELGEVLVPSPAIELEKGLAPSPAIQVRHAARKGQVAALVLVTSRPEGCTNWAAY